MIFPSITFVSSTSSNCIIPSGVEIATLYNSSNSVSLNLSQNRVATLSGKAGKAGKAGKWYLFQVHVWGCLEFSILFGFSSKKDYKL